MTTEFDAYIGKVLGKDVTETELQVAFPQYKVAIYKPTTIHLGVAGLKPNRLRVWLDTTGKIDRMVVG